MKLVCICSDEKIKEDVEFANEGTKYRSERRILVRNINAEEIIQFVMDKMGVSQAKLRSKHSKRVVEKPRPCSCFCTEACVILNAAIYAECWAI